MCTHVSQTCVTDMCIDMCYRHVYRHLSRHAYRAVGHEAAFETEILDVPDRVETALHGIGAARRLVCVLCLHVCQTCGTGDVARVFKCADIGSAGWMEGSEEGSMDRLWLADWTDPMGGLVVNGWIRDRWIGG